MSKTYITQPFLPPLEEFMPYLEKIWQEKWLTYNNSVYRQLENKLVDYLSISQRLFHSTNCIVRAQRTRTIKKLITPTLDRHTNRIKPDSFQIHVNS